MRFKIFTKKTRKLKPANSGPQNILASEIQKAFFQGV